MKRKLILLAVILGVVTCATAAAAYWVGLTARIAGLWNKPIAVAQPHVEHRDPSGSGSEARDRLQQLTRSLQMLQDQIVDGSSAAVDAQSHLLQRMAKDLPQIEAGAWKKAGNQRALSIYLLSGGSARPVRELLNKAADFGDGKPMILALLAYAEQHPHAAELLAKLAAATIDASIAGNVALAQAIASDAKPDIAAAHLATAKLLAPGTLVEEAAFRREIKMLLTAGHEAAAVQVATRYLWRFARSVYAREVAEYLAERVLPDLAAAPDKRKSISGLLAQLPVAQRKHIVLSMGRNGVLSGNLSVAAFAAQEAAHLSDASNADQMRAHIYDAIAKSLSRDAASEASFDALRAIDRRLLSAGDAGILDAARAVNDRVRQPTGMEPVESGEPFHVVASARELIARGDRSLAETIE
jgi:chemotaxis protein MotC